MSEQLLIRIFFVISIITSILISFLTTYIFIVLTALIFLFFFISTVVQYVLSSTNQSDHSYIWQKVTIFKVN